MAFAPLSTIPLLLTLVLSAIAPGAAAAQPECLQVYPWSELCQGDVDDFVEALVGDPIDVDCSVARVLCAVDPDPSRCLDRECLAIGEILPPPACPGGPPCPPDPTAA